MKTYHVSFSHTEYRTATVEAPTEEEAVAMVRRGEYDDSSFDMAEGFELVDVELEEDDD